ncbi:DOMON domain-containing protein frrs1L [Cichlidogyrus casuarinus]|uniref:ascorbate ferrireductase (transmembrane) n=1 Tax=Cichlidogyrus casuarinus TaxID=1844966 RepID=A0ABD2Q1P9_9PLAT
MLIEGTEYIEFELLGSVPREGGYVSLGFSEDQIKGNDGVIGCYYPAKYDDPVRFFVGYNARDPRTGEVTNKFIETLPEVTYVFLSSLKNFMITEGENLGGEYTMEGKLLCRFRRMVVPPEHVDKLKDLSTSQYYLIHTRGQKLTSSGFGEPLPGGEAFAPHPVVVSSLVYGSMTGAPGEGDSTAKAHGACMVLAWVFCSSVGIILARYYKDVWPNSGLFGQRVWFQLHRILQISCVFLTILGLILILIRLNGQYSQTSTWPNLMHPILGIIVIALTILNPLLALCRCHPAHERRPWFNWIHFIVGTLAYILAVPTMMIGLRLPAAGVLLASKDYPSAILLFFMIFHVICEMSLEIHGCIYHKRNTNQRREYEEAMDQYTAAIRVQSGPMHKPDEPNPSGRMFKYFVIGLHATVSAIVAVLLVIIIAVN